MKAFHVWMEVRNRACKDTHCVLLNTYMEARYTNSQLLRAKIYNLAVECGITLAQAKARVADATETSVSAIEQMMRGAYKPRPSEKRQLKISTHLKVSRDELFPFDEGQAC